MKIKINKEQQAKIVEIRKLISAHQLEQDTLVDGFIASMNLVEEVLPSSSSEDFQITSTKSEIVWDYIYNDSGWMIELE
jgi:citrate lyase synthetase